MYGENFKLMNSSCIFQTFAAIIIFYFNKVYKRMKRMVFVLRMNHETRNTVSNQLILSAITLQLERDDLS